MKALRIFLLVVLILSAVGMTARAQGIMSRTQDIGIVGGLWLGGDVDLSYPSVTLTKDAGLLVRAFYDTYLVEKFSVGVYGNYAPYTVSYGGTSVSGTMFEFGAAFKVRFPISNGAAALKPGLNIGYRMMSIDLPGSSDSKGLGINLSLELQFNSKGVIPMIEAGFLSEPAGGNKSTNVTWAPIIYIAGGIAF